VNGIIKCKAKNELDKELPEIDTYVAYTDNELLTLKTVVDG
jgi:hypothetical protein